MNTEIFLDYKNILYPTIGRRNQKIFSQLQSIIKRFHYFLIITKKIFLDKLINYSVNWCFSYILVNNYLLVNKYMCFIYLI